MPLFIIIRKPIKDGFFPSNTENPSENELLLDLKQYKKIYLLRSLDEAKTIAESFFSAPREPKTGGFYGLIAEVSINQTKLIEMVDIDSSTIFNNWVDSQKLKYIKNENSGVNIQSTIVSSEDIESISNTFIPENAKAYNANLQDTDFTRASSSCSLM